VLPDLRRALSDPDATPEQIAAGLRQAMLAVGLSQFAIVAVPAGVAALLARPAQAELGWSWWLIALAVVMTATLVAGAERAFTVQPSLRAGLQFAIFLGVGAAIPGIFALLLFALEGLRWGMLALLFVGSQALVYGSFRLLLIAHRVVAARTASEAAPQDTVASAERDEAAGRGTSSAARNAGTNPSVRS
jgi:hypothetical protein